MNNSKKLFASSLWAATMFPMVFFIFFWRYKTIGFALGVREVLLFLGAAHVPATLAFYRDPRFRDNIASNKMLFYTIPLILTLAGGIVFAASSLLWQGIFLCGFWLWQAYHYGKQNIGVYSFGSIAAENKPIDARSKTIFILLAWAGVFGTLKVLGTSAMPAEYHPFFDAAHKVGFVFYLGVVLYACFEFARRKVPFFSYNTLMYFTLVGFFAPMYFSNSVEAAFLSYAIAHGLQYLIFMAIVAAGTEKDGKSSLFMNAFFFVLIVVGIGFLFIVPRQLSESAFYQSSMQAKIMVDFAVGAVLGATMAHFLIDAYTWKLSNPSSRHYILSRFNFIFDRKSA